MIAAIEKVDEQCNGILIHGENFQALNLLQERYREQLKCVYIDPPYNTGGDGFAYKDSYQHSSWISMMFQRLSMLHHLLSEKGVVFSSIDFWERRHLESVMDSIFGKGNRVEEVIWVQNATKNQSPTYSTSHEYVEVYAKSIDMVKSDFSMFREPKPGYAEIVALLEDLNPRYLPLAEVEEALRALFRRHKSQAGRNSAVDEWKGIYNYNRAEYRDKNGKYVSELAAKTRSATLWVWREDNPSMPQVKQDSQKAEFRDPNEPTYRFYRPIHPDTGEPCPHPKTGWRWPYKPHGKQKNCFLKLSEDHRIAWGRDENKIPQTKRFLHEVETNVAKSVIDDFTDGEKELANLFGESRVFGGPKPTTLIQRFCQHAAVNNEVVCDFFAGSGTTGEAIVKLNHKYDVNCRFLLAEMGEHFDTVLKPRIAKAIYSKSWKDGKPTARHIGISHCFKYFRLESYEDALDNLVLHERSEPQQQLLATSPEAREDYMLSYMLDVETQGSASLLNIEQFKDPFNYKLKVTRNNEAHVATVDLVETFNYLIGLRVKHMAARVHSTAEFERDEHGRLQVKGKTKPCENGEGWTFRVIQGRSPSDERVLVIWRVLTDDPEKDNLMLDTFCTKMGFSSRDMEFDLIYVNGDNNLENLRRPDETWKVQLIEENFHRLMFDVRDV